MQFSVVGGRRPPKASLRDRVEASGIGCGNEGKPGNAGEIEEFTKKMPENFCRNTLDLIFALLSTEK